MYLVIINKITSKIEQLQEKYGTTRAFIARKMGISSQSLKALEKSNNPTIYMLAKLSVALDCNITELYEYKLFERKEDYDFYLEQESLLNIEYDPNEYFVDEDNNDND